MGAITEDMILEAQKSCDSINSVERGCIVLKVEINKDYLIFEDKKVLLQEQGKTNQRLLLSICKLAKQVIFLLNWAEPRIETKPCAGAVDKKKADSYVTITKQQLAQVKKKLDVCEVH